MHNFFSGGGGAGTACGGGMFSFCCGFCGLASVGDPLVEVVVVSFFSMVGCGGSAFFSFSFDQLGRDLRDTLESRVPPKTKKNLI